MEIQHVRKASTVTRRRRKNSFSPALVLVLVVFLVIAYLIGASKFGTWLATKVVAPMIRGSSPTVTSDLVIPSAAPAEETEQDMDTLVISLPAMHCYAIQMGVFEKKENAEAQSDNLQTLGAAGYVLLDGGMYRVLAAGYPDETSMEKVRAQLQSEGLDSRAYEVSANGLRLRVKSTDEQLERLEAALAFAAALPGRLSQAAIAFDRDAKSTASGVSEIKEIRDDCKTHAAVVSELSNNADTMLRPIANFLSDIHGLLADLCADSDAETPVFSAALKHLYLDAVFGYQDMANTIESD